MLEANTALAWKGPDFLDASSLGYLRLNGKDGGLSELPATQFPRAVKQANHPTFTLTELGNAKRLVYHKGIDLRFCPPAGKWLIWDGYKWIFDEDGGVERRMKNIAVSIFAIGQNQTDPDKQKLYIKWARTSCSRNGIHHAMELAQSEPGIPIQISDLDRDQFLLGISNGVVNLETGGLREPSRDDLITKQAHVAFDPNASCPQWLAFLDRIMNGDQELIGFLQRMVGYCLTGNTEEQCMFVLHGSGANGKSVFTVTLKRLLGDYALQVQAETLMAQRNNGGPTAEIARLRGARIILATEAEQGQRLAESLIKQMTGGDAITARHLYREPFEFFPHFKLMLVTNHIPQIRGTDDGIWRHMRLIPFEVTIPEDERDPKLMQKLEEEWPGILNWAIKGCLQWQKEGLNPPPVVVNATNDYRKDMDVIGLWLDSSTVRGPVAQTAARDLYTSYETWCWSSGEYPASQREFGQSLRERGYQSKHIRTGTVYLGIRLK